MHIQRTSHFYMLLLVLLAWSTPRLCLSQETPSVVIFNSGDVNYTKAQSLAFSEGIELETKIKSDLNYPPSVSIDSQDGVIYESWTIDGDAASSLASFVEEGGNLILVYSSNYSEENTLFQRIFSISFNAEQVSMSKSSGSFIFPEGSVPSIFDGLDLGMVSFYGTYVLPSYLTVVGDGEKYFLESEETSEKRLISYVYSMGKGNVMLIPSIFGTSTQTPDYDPIDNSYIRFSETFFQDDQIDKFDNEEAVRKALKWLTGSR